MANHHRIAVDAISYFRDGKLDLSEFNSMISVALEDDGKIDDEEKRVIRNVLSKVNRSEFDDATWDRISEVKQKYGI